MKGNVTKSKLVITEKGQPKVNLSPGQNMATSLAACQSVRA